MPHALTFHNLVTVSSVVSRGRTDTLSADGGLTTTLRFDGLLSGYATSALAIEALRQLQALAWYSRNAGGVHVNSDTIDLDDGLYRIDSLTGVAEVSRFLRVSFGLTRLGGAAYGANAVQRVVPSANLQSNSWSITSTPWYALPIGAIDGSRSSSTTRSVADGTISLYQSGSPASYTLTAADYGKGECRIFDTTGSGTEGNWKRVLTPDHQFADPSHLVIDNGSIRFTPLTTGHYGQHALAIHNGSAWTTFTGADGDWTLAGSAGVAWRSVTIDTLTPWQVKATWAFSRGSNPHATKSITINRGAAVGLVQVSFAGGSNATIQLGLSVTSGGYVFGRETDDNVGDAVDHSVTSGNVVVAGSDDDNWLGLFVSGSSFMGIGAVRTSAPTYYKYTAGGFLFDQGTTTSFQAYLGGIAYSSTNVNKQAESGTLSGTAAITTVAGSSGGGSNNAVTLPATNDRVYVTGNPPTGVGVRLYVRVQNVGTSASDSVKVEIWNNTGGTSGGSTTKTFSALGSTGTWKWMSCETLGWNGTDTLHFRCDRSASAGGGTLYCDQFFFVTITTSGGYGAIKEIANAALTETTVWPSTTRLLW